MLVEESERLGQDGVSEQMGGKDPIQLLDEFGAFEQQIPELDYQNASRRVVFADNNEWDFAASLFFIALLSNLNSWDDSDP